MASSALPPSPRKTALGLIGLFVLAMNPPIINVVNRATLVAGMASLYLWFVGWGLLISAVLIWAAATNAFGLTNDQIPPELKESLDNPDAKTHD